jgi:predicted phage terminase large subunit-like protein
VTGHEISAKEAIHRADILSYADLGYFTQRVFGVVSPNDVYEHNWHIDCISEHLRALERGEIRRLIVNMPPRFLKSISISIAWPAWLLGHNPKEQVLVCAYTAALAGSLSIKCRDVMQSDWYRRIFSNTVLKKELETELITTQGGMRYATGVGGTLLGKGGSVLVIDDPLDPTQAASDVERQNANEWIKSTFLTRFNDKRTGKAVVVMQRLHADDVSGMLLEMGGWHHLCLPGEFKERKTISIGTKKWEMNTGDSLDVKRFTPEIIEQTKREYADPFKYEAQVNQNPTPDDGMFFKKTWMKFYEKLPDGLRYYGSSDYAVTEDGGDYTVHLIMGVCPDDDWYVVDMWRERTGSDQWAEAQVDMTEEYKPLEWLEEKGVIEKAVDPLITKLMQERKVFVWRRKVASVNDKVTRATALRGRMASGRVWFPKSMPWMGAVLKEIMEFPNSKNDDIVDSLSLFGRSVHQLRKGVVMAPQKKGEVKIERPTFGEMLASHKRKLKKLREA